MDKLPRESWRATKTPHRQFWKYHYPASDQSIDAGKSGPLSRVKQNDEVTTSSIMVDKAASSAAVAVGDQSPASEYADLPETLFPSNPGTPNSTRPATAGASTPKSNLSPQRRLNWLNDLVSASKADLRTFSQLPSGRSEIVSDQGHRAPRNRSSSTNFGPVPPVGEPGFGAPLHSPSASQFVMSPHQPLITGLKSCSSSPSLGPKQQMSHLREASREGVSTDDCDRDESVGQNADSVTRVSTGGNSTAKSHALEAAISQLLQSPATTRSSPRRSPLGTPVRKLLVSVREYLGEMGHLTTLDHRDNWLPVTASRTGNAYYSAFHNINACLGFQALFLPAAFAYLGWSWGIISLVVAFAWQLYTNWLLIMMHEVAPGKRVNRYVELSQLAFGERLGFHIALPMVLNLASGAGVGLIVIGGTALKLFFLTLCHECELPLSTIEWFLLFASFCALLVHLPNLNSVAGVSLVGAIMAGSYCTLVWILSVSRRAHPVSYDIVRVGEPAAAAVIFSTLNAFGTVAFAFRGHNLTLEIQATMPSDEIQPAHVPMWNGTKLAYAIIALCYFPVSICGYWAYGAKISEFGSILSALASSTKHAMSQHSSFQSFLGLTFLLVVLHSLSSFQLYSMQVFDMMEKLYAVKTMRRVSVLERFSMRTFYVFVVFFFAIAFPFVASFGGLIGGLNIIPVTFVLPCFMWLAITKPRQRSFDWYLNWSLGLTGSAISAAVAAGGIWSIIQVGVQVKFFKPAG